MTEANWGASLLWALVFIYALAGSVDFGAGFWAMVFYSQKNARAATIANRYLSPLWEVTNVFLILFAVALVGLFPKAAFAYGSVLLVPGDLILIFLTIRTVFMVYAHSVEKYQGALRVVSGLTGLLIPALLVTVLPLAQGAAIQYSEQGYQLSLATLFGTSRIYSYIVLALLSELFLSAMFLADYARVAEDKSAYQSYRRLALWFGPLSMVSALVVLWSIRSSWLHASLGREWLWFLASFVCFGLAMLLILGSHSPRHGRFRVAVLIVAAQYALAMIGYGRAHMPYLLYPYLTVQDSFTTSSMFRSLLVVLILGIAILFPGFVWFWRLFLENKSYVAKP
ncbi:MAG: hypothetical protein A2201_07115 [Alicyclobacillus sp. RIFOXYA1_FULL_53_8]|nr:MAG: hypothetical protein A2201_07115 [Alicyclobacillus sp. RIFOXYA1_FULL_53_8]